MRIRHLCLEFIFLFRGLLDLEVVVDVGEFLYAGVLNSLLIVLRFLGEEVVWSFRSASCYCFTCVAFVCNMERFHYNARIGYYLSVCLGLKLGAI